MNKTPLRAATASSLKFLLPILFPTLLFAQTPWTGAADSTWYTSNKETNTYTIYTAEELAGLAEVVKRGTSFQGKTITLGANIVLNDTTLNEGWRNWGVNGASLKQWVPIGNYGNADSRFQGNFDGNGKVISGLYISNTNDYQGLFGYTERLYGVTNGAKISNIGLVGFYVKGRSFVGGLAGGIPSGQIINS